MIPAKPREELTTGTSAASPRETVFSEVVLDVLRRGYSARFRATGRSMLPAIRDGETITVEAVDASAVRAGDVVLYRSSRGLIAHRVIRIETGYSESQGGSKAGGCRFILRGDASLTPEPPVKPESVVGRVVAVGRTWRSAAVPRRYGMAVRRLGELVSRWMKKFRRGFGSNEKADGFDLP